jgi:L-gulonolactone oxidase
VKSFREEFSNWSGTVKTRPSSWHAPTSEEEIAALVRNAARDKKRVRVVGAGHSWSRIAAPDDIAVTLDGWSGPIDIDAAAGTAVFRAGTRLREINAALAAHGLAMPILGSIAEQSIAGAIATGTHGSSLVHGNLSSLVTSVRLIDGSGETYDIGPEDPRLDGVRVHLGALGALTRVTVRVVPAFRLAEKISRIPVAAVAGELETIASSAEYVKVWWLPHTSHAYVHRYERTEDPPSRRPTAETDRFIDEHIVQGAILPTLFALHARWPSLIPPWNRFAARLIPKPRRVGVSHLLLSTPMPALHRETEAAIPLARGGEAFDRTVALVERERVRVNFILECRFVRGDSTWMSPAHGGDTVQLGAYMAETSETNRYFDGFWREMRAIGGRPHWGKELDLDADEVRARWPETSRFLALRDALDPARTFGGAFHTRVLGP